MLVYLSYVCNIDILKFNRQSFTHHYSEFIRIRPISVNFIVNVDLRACINVSCASFTTAGPRAIFGACLHDCFVRETLCSTFVEFHEYCLKCRLDYKRNKEKESKQTECAKEHKKCSRVEESFLFECSFVNCGTTLIHFYFFSSILQFINVLSY